MSVSITELPVLGLVAASTVEVAVAVLVASLAIRNRREQE